MGDIWKPFLPEFLHKQMEEKEESVISKEKNSLTFQYIQNAPRYSQPSICFGSDADPAKAKVIISNLDINAFYQFQITHFWSF